MNEPIFGYIICGVLGALTGLVIFLIAHAFGKEHLEKEAVEKGFAEWCVASNGTTKFEWKK